MLIYNGNGYMHITGVPARDLSEEEVNELAARFGVSQVDFVVSVTAHGLYDIDTPPPSAVDEEETETTEEGGFEI